VLEDFFLFPSWKTMQPLVLKTKYFLGDKITRYLVSMLVET